jgi:hypothetical protein
VRLAVRNTFGFTFIMSEVLKSTVGFCHGNNHTSHNSRLAHAHNIHASEGSRIKTCKQNSIEPHTDAHPPHTRAKNKVGSLQNDIIIQQRCHVPREFALSIHITCMQTPHLHHACKSVCTCAVITLEVRPKATCRFAREHDHLSLAPAGSMILQLQQAKQIGRYYVIRCAISSMIRGI